eukprot:TRINITY_DN1635_c0_g18_i1.p1 TRINITY_DN1635_c0_g18~~TRINITY_DN1635_c0_g18_i1.p1  ORF type:complete len:230 (-),score=52.07 TRINITY_DN1635_c0_g18_i1:180-869(-)
MHYLTTTSISDDPGYHKVLIHVFLSGSNIYSADDGEMDTTGPEETSKGFDIDAPIYADQGVPMRVLIELTAQKANMNLTGYQVLYKKGRSEMFTLAGIFPHDLPNQFFDVDPFEVVYLKFRVSCEVRAKTSKKKKEDKKRRGNERRIGEVIDAVDRWVRISARGVINRSGECVKCTKKQAADLLGIPKKTLDDYRHQLEIAKSKNFDFHLHSKEKFGVIRMFNRKMARK